MPDHWQTTTLGEVAEVRMGQQLSPSRRSGARPRPYLRAANIGASGIDLADVNLMDFSEEEEERYALLPRDILLVEGGNEKSVGCPALVSNSEEGLCFQNTLIRCRIRDFGIVVPEFLYFALLRSFVNGEFARLAQGTTILHLGQRRAEAFQVDLPPIAQQRRLVDLIGSVDRYIMSLQIEDEATRTARSALLAESLSRPAEGWKTSTLGQVADVVSGGTPKTGEPAFWNGDVMWVTPTEVVANNGRTVFSTDRMITEAGLNSCAAKLLPVDTVLLTSRATIGAVALAGVPLATNQGFASLVCGKEVLPKFVMYWCQANKQKFVARAGGNTFLEISRKKVASTPIDVPPLTEQRRIVDLVESVDEQIVSLGIQIEAAQTLRNGVLSELLSGERLLDESYDVAVSL